MTILFKKLSGWAGVNSLIIAGLVLSFSCKPLLAAQVIDKSLEKQKVSLIWITESKQEHQVFFSTCKGEKWAAPVLLAAGKEQLYHPAVSAGDDGTIWAVWIREDEGKSFLEWSEYSSTGWSQPRRVATDFDRNTAVSVLVDKDNVPWIAWSGVEKRYPDIFWSRWNGKAWDKAARAHAVNEVPDLDPSLALDENGHVVLSWQTFTDGRYVTVDKIWAEQGWRTEFFSSKQTKIKNNLYERARNIILPDFVKDPDRASLYIQSKDGSASIPVIDF